MIKIYGMPTCPDCAFVERQVEGNAGYEVIDIGSDVRLMKEFLRLRDTDAAFDAVKPGKGVGIPCFVLDDGTVTLSAQDAGLEPRPAEGEYCSLDGKGC